MQTVLVDAGPLIALFDKDDEHHAGIRDLLRNTTARLVTTWPVVTETSHMPDFDLRAQLGFCHWLVAGGATVHDRPRDALSRVIDLVRKYRHRAMDLADATLVVAAEQLGINNIISIDRDFDIYRTARRTRIVNLYTRT